MSEKDVKLLPYTRIAAAITGQLMQMELYVKFTENTDFIKNVSYKSA